MRPWMVAEPIARVVEQASGGKAPANGHGSKRHLLNGRRINHWPAAASRPQR